MHAERGFTLIEILVVVLIIGITIGFALLAFGDFGASRRATISAEHFLAYIKLVQQQAIVEGNTLGISLSHDGYTTYRFEGGNWIAMPTKSIFHPHHFPTNVIASLKYTPRSNQKTPDILINPSGDVSNFIVDFGTNQKPTIKSLVGKIDGQMVLQQAVKYK